MQLDTAKQRCFQRIAKKTMYPDMALATAAAQGVFKDELPGRAVPPSVVAELASKVRRSAT